MTESPLVKRLLWSGLLAGSTALTQLLANRLSVYVWKRFFDEEPPE